MKKDQYFNLEVNLLNDDNIASMMSEMNAAEALGIYVILLLHLRTKDAYEASCKPVLLKTTAPSDLPKARCDGISKTNIKERTVVATVV